MRLCHDLDCGVLYKLNNTKCYCNISINLEVWQGNKPQIFIFTKTHNINTIIIKLENKQIISGQNQEKPSTEFDSF